MPKSSESQAMGDLWHTAPGQRSAVTCSNGNAPREKWHGGAPAKGSTSQNTLPSHVMVLHHDTTAAPSQALTVSDSLCNGLNFPPPLLTKYRRVKNAHARGRLKAADKVKTNWALGSRLRQVTLHKAFSNYFFAYFFFFPPLRRIEKASLWKL